MFGKLRMIGATKLSFSYSATRLPTTSVSTDITSFACGSNIQHRGRSSASSASSDVPETNKGRKKVSKTERRAMVESFVNKYRAMNGGKFPSVTDTRKQVGGSHYLLRQIVQELEYKSKLSPLTSESENLPGKQPTQENQSEVGGEHSGFLTTKNEVLGGDAKTVSNTILEKADYDKKVEAQGDSVFVAPEDVGKKVEARGDPGFAAPEVKIHKGEIEEFPPLAEREDADSKLEETTVSEDSVDVRGTKSKAVPEPKQYSMDNCGRQSDAELAKKPSLWGNLKSFADSIISRWRK